MHNQQALHLLYSNLFHCKVFAETGRENRRWNKFSCSMKFKEFVVALSSAVSIKLR